MLPGCMVTFVFIASYKYPATTTTVLTTTAATTITRVCFVLLGFLSFDAVVWAAGRASGV